MSSPEGHSQFYGSVTVSVDGSTVVLGTTDLPDHVSPYWGQGHARYEAPHSGMQVNPHKIGTQNITLRVPASPAEAASPSDTPLGPMGVAINGVVLFNQYAAGRQPLTSEVVSFDRLNGHPNQQDQYHYHLEPLWLTRSSSSRPIGVLLDGFPVYGPRDSGGQTPSGLDVCNGTSAPRPSSRTGSTTTT